MNDDNSTAGWGEIYHWIHTRAEILRKQKAASDVTRQDAPEAAQLPTLENEATAILPPTGPGRESREAAK